MGRFDVATHAPQVRKVMGYCPQFDALNDLLSGEEHLRLYGKMRGVPDETPRQD